jgi:hypothetical protein
MNRTSVLFLLLLTVAFAVTQAEAQQRVRGPIGPNQEITWEQGSDERIRVPRSQLHICWHWTTRI